jgi:hypothetical protein
MKQSQTDENELDAKKNGQPSFASGLPRIPEQWERRGNQHEGPAHHAIRLGLRLQPVFVLLAHEGGDWRVRSSMAIKDIASQVGDAFNLPTAVLLCFLQRIEDQAAMHHPWIKVVPIARQIRSSLSVAEKDGILRRLDNLHPAR